MTLRNVVVAVALLLSLEKANAQSKPASMDKSPMDMAYYPTDYPVLKIQVTIERQIRRNSTVIVRLISIRTSAVPKKLQRKPLTR